MNVISKLFVHVLEKRLERKLNAIDELYAYQMGATVLPADFDINLNYCSLQFNKAVLPYICKAKHSFLGELWQIALFNAIDSYFEKDDDKEWVCKEGVVYAINTILDDNEYQFPDFLMK